MKVSLIFKNTDTNVDLVTALPGDATPKSDQFVVTHPVSIIGDSIFDTIKRLSHYGAIERNNGNKVIKLELLSIDVEYGIKSYEVNIITELVVGVISNSKYKFVEVSENQTVMVELD